MTDDGPVAWCCAHYPNTCSAHGFTETQPQATMIVIEHWEEAHL